MNEHERTIREISHAMWHQRENKPPLCPQCDSEAVNINREWYCLKCLMLFEAEEVRCPICT